MLKKRSLLLALSLLSFTVACSGNAVQETRGSGGGDSGGGDSGSANSGSANSGSASSGGQRVGAGGEEPNVGGSGGNDPDDALVVPERLTIIPLAGGTGVLHLFALTLRQGPSNIEVYAALKNEGNIAACAASITVELYDKDQLSLSAELGGAFTKHLYERNDGSGQIASCVAPGEVTMTAITNFGTPVAVGDVYYIVYRSPYFALDVTDIGGFGIDQVKSQTGDGGTSYSGVFVNELDIAVKAPGVSIFPVNRVGRPLGRAIAAGTDEILPGGSWSFETSSVDALGSDYFAYAYADPSN